MRGRKYIQWIGKGEQRVKRGGGKRNSSDSVGNEKNWQPVIDLFDRVRVN